MKSLSVFIREAFIRESKGITRDGKEVETDKPQKLRGEAKAFVVYRKTDKIDDETGLPIVFAIKFGDSSMSVKNDDPARVKSFWSRHQCDKKKDKKTAGYWACYSPEKFGKELGLKGGNSRW